MKHKVVTTTGYAEVEILRSVVAAAPGVDCPAARPPKAPQLTLANRRPFEQCGIRFLSATGPLPKMSSPVCLDDCGRLLVPTSRITARFDGRLSRRTITGILEQASAGVRLGRQLGFAPNTFDIRVDPGRDVFLTAERIARHHHCRYAVPELLQRFERRQLPDDPKLPKQWHISAIHADEAWRISDGSSTSIAIIDFGFDLSHRDLAGAVMYAGCFRELGVLQKASFFASADVIPVDSHGTSCAGMAVARANSRDGCGIAFGASLVPIAASTTMTHQTLARAIAYAADPASEQGSTAGQVGADVLSISVTPANSAMSPAVGDALDFAGTKGRGERGMPVFFAVANQNTDIARDKLAADERVIAVGSVSESDRRVSQTAKGEELDLLAPGKNVWTTGKHDDFVKVSGSSYATPCAAAVACLMYSVNPSLTLAAVRRILENSCDKVGGNIYGSDGHNNRYGFGRVNAEQAVRLAADHP
jgi:subtilisin family serine protease